MVGWLDGWLFSQPTRVNPRFDICVSYKGRIFFQCEVMFPVDSESSVSTSSISRLDLPAQSLGGAHRGRGVRVRERLCCTVFLKNNNGGLHNFLIRCV